MRAFEAMLIFSVIIHVLFSSKMKKSQFFWIFPFLNLLIFLCHGILEGLRWQMFFIYLYMVLILVISSSEFLLKLEIKIKKILLRVMHVVGMLLIVATILLTIVMPVFKLPALTGEYPVSTMAMHFIDRSRPEVYTEEENDNRELMVTLWYPAEKSHTEKEKPYLTNLKVFGPAVTKQVELPNFLLNYFNNVKTNVMVDAPISTKKATYPLLLFSHGIGVPTEFYTSILSEIASHGYIVAAIEHPYSTIATTFPDGKVTTFKTQIETFSEEKLVELERIWVQDIEFVLQQLESLNNEGNNKILKSRIELDRVGVFGHSFGGAVSYLTCFSNDKIKAGINMDGSIFHFSGQETNRDKSFLLLTTNDYTSALQQSANFPDYFELDKKQRLELVKQGITKELYDINIKRAKASIRIFDSIIQNGGYYFRIEGIKHYNFSDIPLFSPAMRMTDLVGRIDKDRGLKIINKCILEFFNKNLKGIKGSLSEISSNDYPEVHSANSK